MMEFFLCSTCYLFYEVQKKRGSENKGAIQISWQIYLVLQL
jgi:hypothetical protein